MVALSHLGSKNEGEVVALKLCFHLWSMALMNTCLSGSFMALCRYMVSGSADAAKAMGSCTTLVRLFQAHDVCRDMWRCCC